MAQTNKVIDKLIVSILGDEDRVKNTNTSSVRANIDIFSLCMKRQPGFTQVRFHGLKNNGTHFLPPVLYKFSVVEEAIIAIVTDVVYPEYIAG